MSLRVTVRASGREAMADLVRVHAVDIVRMTARGDDATGWSVDAVVSRAQAARLREHGYAVDVVEDANARLAALQRDVAWHPADRPSWLG